MIMESSPTTTTTTTTERTPLLSHARRIPDDSTVVDNLDSESISKTTMFWQEMRTLPVFALPVFGAQIVEHSLVFVPVIFVGHISTSSLAAVSLGSMTAAVSGLSMLQGLSSALDTLLPSAWTSPQPQLMGLWAQRMWVVLTCATIPIVFVWCNAEPILLALKQDPDVARLAAIYLRYFTSVLPAYSFNLISRRYFQSQGLLTLQTSIICCVAPINVLLNYLLVVGPDPIRLGFVGAPITTAISHTLVSLVSLWYGTLYVPRTGWHPISGKMFTHLSTVMSLGLSGIGQTASEWWAWEGIALAASFLGPLALASQSVLLTSSSTLFQFPFSLANATAIRVGNLLGEKKARRAEVTSKASIVLSSIVGGLLCTFIMAFRNSLGYLFNDDPELLKMVASVLPIIAVYQIIDGNAAVTAAILRAKGDQFVGAILNLIAYYIIGLPLGMWLAFPCEFELGGLWIGLSIALIIISGAGSYLCLTTDWSFEVQKVEERLQRERSCKIVDREGSVLCE